MIIVGMIADLETNNHDNKGDHHDDGVTTLETQLVTLTPGRHHSVYQGSWKDIVCDEAYLVFDVNVDNYNITVKVLKPLNAKAPRGQK